MHICNNQIQIKIHMDITILLSLSKFINSKIELKKNSYLYANTIFFSLIKKMKFEYEIYSIEFNHVQFLFDT